MSPLFKKLNLKNHQEILALNVSYDFEKELQSLDNVIVKRNLNDVKQIEFSIAFITKQKDLDLLSQSIIEKVHGDAVLWFAYPKMTSKNFKCEFNRDNGWRVLMENGFLGVRQVAIDADWSALRFRRIEFIKVIARKNAHA